MLLNRSQIATELMIKERSDHPRDALPLGGDVMRGFIAGALVATCILGASGCSTTDQEVVSTDASVEVDSVAYGYFGSTEVAQGSSLDTVIDNVESSADVTVVNTPAGVTAVVADSDGSARLQLTIADDAPIGGHNITFEIAGEPEQVNWTIQILPR